jgi:hypothetical protein
MATDARAWILDPSQSLGVLERHIQDRLSGRVRDFRLSVREGGLLLQGRTHTYYAKQLAQQAVMESVDLPIGANAIEVV